MKKTNILRTIIGALVATTCLTVTTFAYTEDSYGNYIISAPKSNITKPSDEELSKIRQEMLKLVNAERAKVGASALVLDDKANQMAQDHSEDMAKNGYMGHNSPSYGDYTDRAVIYSIITDNISEICCYGTSSLERAIQGWMNSYGHKIALLGTDVTKMGVGFCDGYWTIDFYGPNVYEHQTFTAEEEAIIAEQRALLDSL